MPHICTNGISMHYEGEGTGDPLLLIMGIGGSGALWEKHAALWSAHFRCIAGDNRGIGLTDKPPGPYSSAMMADDYAGLIRQLGIEPMRVIGCSMGSIVAQQLAIRHPELIRSLVLMCPWARCDAYAQAVFQHIAACKARLRPEEFMDYLQLLIFSKASWDDSSMRRQMLESRSQAAVNPDPQPLHALEAQAAACVSHDVFNLLPRITCPAFVVGGTNDIFTPVWMAREVASQIPGCELHLYEGAGHAFHWERLDDFNRRVLDWLQTT